MALTGEKDLFLYPILSPIPHSPFILVCRLIYPVEFNGFN